MPAPLPLTSERLVRHGLFMMEDGQSIFLWLGRDAVPQLLLDVFGVDRMDQLHSGKVSFT
jgi:protein transport protein SEC24